MLRIIYDLGATSLPSNLRLARYRNLSFQYRTLGTDFVSLRKRVLALKRLGRWASSRGETVCALGQNRANPLQAAFLARDVPEIDAPAQ